MLRAKDVTEAAQLKAKFIQAQVAKAGEQSKEFYDGDSACPPHARPFGPGNSDQSRPSSSQTRCTSR